MAHEDNKDVLPSLINEFRQQGAGLKAFTWLVKAGYSHALITNRAFRRLRSSFYRHVLVLWLINIVAAVLVQAQLPQGMPWWGWTLHVCLMGAGTFIAYLMLGMVKQEGGDRYYTRFPIPNTLTMFRLFMTPLVMVAIIDPTSKTSNTWLVFTLLAVSAVSDTLDGNIARIFHLKSDFGRAWDPVVDVFFHTMVASALFVRGIIPWWFLVIVLARYLLPIIVGPVLYLFHSCFKVKSTWPGKLSTFMLSGFMGLFFIARLLHSNWLESFTLGTFLWITVVVNILTVIYFMVRGTMVVSSKGT